MAHRHHPSALSHRGTPVHKHDPNATSEDDAIESCMDALQRSAIAVRSRVRDERLVHRRQRAELGRGRRIVLGHVGVRPLGGRKVGHL